MSQPQQPKPPPQILADLKHLLELYHEALAQNDAPRAYLQSRKVEDGQISRHLLGYCPEGATFLERVPPSLRTWAAVIDPGSVIFPLYTPLFGYTGLVSRSLAGKRYGHFTLPNFESYPRFFGNQDNVRSVFLHRSVFLCEGTFDHLALELAFPNVLSTVTASVSPAQRLFLLPIVDVFINVFDSDAEGESGWGKLKDTIPTGKEAYRMKIPYKDPSKALEQMGKVDFVKLIQSLGSNLMLLSV